jgi:hypothetical protein
MNHPPNIETLIRPDDTARERAQLRLAHTALVRASPLPELPLSIRRPPPVIAIQPRPSERAHRRMPRSLAALAAAATVAAVAASAGYLLTGNSAGRPAAVVAMHATAAAPGARGLLRIGERDQAGNWPLTLLVSRLPHLSTGSYYEIDLTDKGRLVGSCGVFTTDGGATVIHLNVPYKLGEYSGWIIRRQHPGIPPSQTLLSSA